jgi:hypothetical protein
MAELSNQERLLAMENYSGVLERVSLVREELQKGFVSLTDLINELKNELSESEELRRVLELVENRRKAWITRISENQRNFPAPLVACDNINNPTSATDYATLGAYRPLSDSKLRELVQFKQ